MADNRFSDFPSDEEIFNAKEEIKQKQEEVISDSELADKGDVGRLHEQIDDLAQEQQRQNIDEINRQEKQERDARTERLKELEKEERYKSKQMEILARLENKLDALQYKTAQLEDYQSDTLAPMMRDMNGPFIQRAYRRNKRRGLDVLTFAAGAGLMNRLGIWRGMGDAVMGGLGIGNPKDPTTGGSAQRHGWYTAAATNVGIWGGRALNVAAKFAGLPFLLGEKIAGKNSLEGKGLGAIKNLFGSLSDIGGGITRRSKEAKEKLKKERKEFQEQKKQERAAAREQYWKDLKEQRAKEDEARRKELNSKEYSKWKKEEDKRRAKEDRGKAKEWKKADAYADASILGKFMRRGLRGIADGMSEDFLHGGRPDDITAKIGNFVKIPTDKLRDITRRWKTGEKVDLKEEWKTTKEEMNKLFKNADGSKSFFEKAKDFVTGKSRREAEEKNRDAKKGDIDDLKDNFKSTFGTAFVNIGKSINDLKDWITNFFSNPSNINKNNFKNETDGTGTKENPQQGYSWQEKQEREKGDVNKASESQKTDTGDKQSGQKTNTTQGTTSGASTSSSAKASQTTQQTAHTSDTTFTQDRTETFERDEETRENERKEKEEKEFRDDLTEENEKQSATLEENNTILKKLAKLMGMGAFGGDNKGGSKFFGFWGGGKGKGKMPNLKSAKYKGAAGKIKYAKDFVKFGSGALLAQGKGLLKGTTGLISKVPVVGKPLAGALGRLGTATAGMATGAVARARGLFGSGTAASAAAKAGGKAGLASKAAGMMGAGAKLFKGGMPLARLAGRAALPISVAMSALDFGKGAYDPESMGFEKSLSGRLGAGITGFGKGMASMVDLLKYVPVLGKGYKALSKALTGSETLEGAIDQGIKDKKENKRIIRDAERDNEKAQKRQATLAKINSNPELLEQFRAATKGIESVDARNAVLDGFTDKIQRGNTGVDAIDRQVEALIKKGEMSKDKKKKGLWKTLKALFGYGDEADNSAAVASDSSTTTSGGGSTASGGGTTPAKSKKVDAFVIQKNADGKYTQGGQTYSKEEYVDILKKELYADASKKGLKDEEAYLYVQKSIEQFKATGDLGKQIDIYAKAGNVANETADTRPITRTEDAVVDEYVKRQREAARQPDSARRRAGEKPQRSADGLFDLSQAGYQSTDMIKQNKSWENDKEAFNAKRKELFNLVTHDKNQVKAVTDKRAGNKKKYDNGNKSAGRGETERAQKAARFVRAGAAGGSTGHCGSYVATALQKAGYPMPAKGNHAYSYMAKLPAMGFTRIDDTGRYKDGDVMVYPKNSQHDNGHVQIYSNGNWVSDWVQNTIYPWTKGPDGSQWRWRHTGVLFRDMGEESLAQLAAAEKGENSTDKTMLADKGVPEDGQTSGPQDGTITVAANNSETTKGVGSEQSAQTAVAQTSTAQISPVTKKSPEVQAEPGATKEDIKTLLAENKKVEATPQIVSGGENKQSQKAPMESFADGIVKDKKYAENVFAEMQAWGLYSA